MYGVIRLLLGFYALGRTLAQTAATVNDDWIHPANALVSDEVLIIGDTYTFQWTSNLTKWFPQYAPDIDPSNCDVWIGLNPNSERCWRIKSGFNIASNTELNWLVEPPSNERDPDVNYRVILRQVGWQFDPEKLDPNFQSPGFYIQSKAGTTTASNSIATSATSSSGSSGPTTTSAGAAAAISSSSGPASSSRISAGALAGIVIGAVLILAIAGGGLFVWNKRRQHAASAPNYGPRDMYNSDEKRGLYAAPPGVAAAASPDPSELPGQSYTVPQTHNQQRSPEFGLLAKGNATCNEMPGTQ